MSFAQKVKEMLGFGRQPNEEKPASKRDPVGVAISRAVQKNEIASEQARQAIVDLLDTSDRARGAQ